MNNHLITTNDTASTLAVPAVLCGKIKALLFFYKNAGSSYTPGKETPEQGKARGARALAKAESIANQNGWRVRWDYDQTTDSRDFSNEEPWALWFAALLDEGGACLASLGAVDFGPNGQPWGNDYRRVVEAELALQALEIGGGNE